MLMWNLKKTDETGLTLLELVIIITILGFSFPMILTFFGKMLQSGSHAIIINQSQALASDLLEEIRSKRWDENRKHPTAFLASEANEVRQTFDDIDDYNGLNNSPPLDFTGNPIKFVSKYKRQVSICYVTTEHPDKCIDTTTMYKKVVVTVDTPLGVKGGESVALFGNWQ